MPLSPHQVLEKYWGYPQFRPQQEAIINSVLSGKDTFALLPTGGGKSLCYQVPGLCNPGLTLVISPLIALMKDQVQQLIKRGIEAEALTSDRSASDIQQIIDQAVDGKLNFLYLSPEKLENKQLQASLKNMPIQLLAVDEAHCISEWGYDFRPAYLQIAQIRTLLPNIPVLAVTATATPDVVRDIQAKLEFPEENVFKLPFLRDNLSYRVIHTEHRWAELLRMLKLEPGSSIVYARNRRGTEEIAHFLHERGVPADFYHAGLSSAIRAKKQELWTQNKLRVMVSTNAFGMGIDKPDVRTVFHVDIPESPEAYFQEAGRAGRDGAFALAVLIVTPSDASHLRKKTTQNRWNAAQLRKVYRALCNQLQIAIGGGGGEWRDLPLQRCAEQLDMSSVQLYSAMRLLESQGIIQLNEFVGNRSSLQFVMPYRQLYEWQSSNEQHADFTRALLRQREGLFDEPHRFDEWEWAANLGLSQSQLVKRLEQLKNYGVIAYEKSTGNPQIMLLESRVDERYLRIDEAHIQQRYQIADLKMQAMIDYSQNTTQCRSQFISAYFGEDDAPECGQCDWCNQTQLPEHTREIVAYLKKTAPISWRDASNELAMTRLQFAEALRILIDEGVVQRQGDQLYLLKQSKL